jgi:hypothetical protein
MVRGDGDQSVPKDEVGLENTIPSWKKSWKLPPEIDPVGQDD